MNDTQINIDTNTKSKLAIQIAQLSLEKATLESQNEELNRELNNLRIENETLRAQQSGSVLEKTIEEMTE